MLRSCDLVFNPCEFGQKPSARHAMRYAKYRAPKGFAFEKRFLLNRESILYGNFQQEIADAIFHFQRIR